MSDGSYAKIRTEPLQNIGAQDLLSIGYLYYGFLRKKRRWDNLTGSSKWKQRFVVLSEGCLYCFNHESSTKPMAAFSLCFYENAHELFLKIPNCFQITHEDPGRASIIFSSESQERRRLWIAHIKDCIEQCGKLSASSINLSDQSIDEGIVADKAQDRPRRDLPPLPKRPDRPDETTSSQAPQKLKRYKETARSEYDLESEEEDEDDDDVEVYDDIDEEDQTQAVAMASARKAQTLPGRVPVLPGMSKLQVSRPVSISSRPKLPLPVPPRQQDSSSDQHGEEQDDYINKFLPSDYQFDSNDREKAKGLLVGKNDGAFLIRKSRSSASQVLSVVVNREVKEFQITEEGQNVSIDKQTFFPSLSSLLNHYHYNDLPKSDYSVKLQKGYNAK